MTWLLSALGAALIAGALRDIYATLWHPHGLGTLSRWVFRIIWSIAGRIRRHGRALGSAGPLGMIATVLLWAAMIVTGWALIYLRTCRAVSPLPLRCSRSRHPIRWRRCICRW